MMIDHINSSLAGLKSPAGIATPAVGNGELQSVDIGKPSYASGSDLPSLESIRAAVDEMNEALQPKTASIHFSLDDETGRTIVKLIDTETNKVIRQIPSEEILAISKALDRLHGLMVHVTA